MDYIKIRNWDHWQTYRKDRGQPPWIKVYRRLLRNPEWVSLSDAERGQLVVMWLLAADRNGVIPASPEVIARLCFMCKPPDLNKFTDLGFLENGWRHSGVTVASSGRQDDAPKAETETEADKKKPASRGHFSQKYQDELVKKIEAAAKLLEGRFKRVYQWTQYHCSKGVHPEAQLYALGEMIKQHDVDDYWAYGNQILKRTDWNFKDEDRMRQAEAESIDFDSIVAAIGRLVEHDN